MGQGPPGGFVSRGELLDISGRVVQGIGGDRVFPGDFDGDGRVDALEPMWSCLAEGSPGYTMDPADPTKGHWDPASPNFDLDLIAAEKSLAFRLWMNTSPSGPPQFEDEADTRIMCRTSGLQDHFGPLDGPGDKDYTGGNVYEKLHTRNWLSTAVADLNNDGSLDLFAVYSPLASGKNGYNVFLNDGTGVLWDLPKEPGTIPSYEDPNFSGPGGATAVGSFSSLLTDYDVDGDFDAFVSFFSVHHRTALLENQFSSASVPVNPYDSSLPGARFVARPRTTSGSVPGWLEGEQPTFNAEAGYPCEAAGSTTTWIGSIDLDLDGDADVTQVEGSPGHRFYLNHGGDAVSPYPALEERSGDHGAGFQCGTQMPDLAAIFWGTRLTAHNSALPVDFDAGDLNGDGLPDLFVNYDSRPANAYFNDGTHGQNVAVGIDPAAALISRVWPPSGARRGESIRIHGVKMANIRYVQLLLGPDASGPQAPIVILSTVPGAITTYPHQRFIDVVIPATTTGRGPAAIVVGRRKNPSTVVPSPVYRSQSFAVIP